MKDHKATEFPDMLHEELEEQHRQEQQRKDDNLRWLEEHMGFRPFGYEW